MHPGGMDPKVKAPKMLWIQTRDAPIIRGGFARTPPISDVKLAYTRSNLGPTWAGPAPTKP